MLKKKSVPDIVSYRFISCTELYYDLWLISENKSYLIFR